MPSTNKRRKISEKPSLPRASQRVFPPIVVAILSGTALLLLIAIAGGAWLLFRNTAGPTVRHGGDPQPSAPAASKPAPALVGAAAPATAAPTAALRGQGDIAQCYAAGVAAYERQEWQPAAAQFQCVYNVDQSYQDIQEKLSATYYNWGVQLLGQGSAAAALDKFNTTLTIQPDHRLALEQQRRLAPYLDALSAIQQQNWAAAVEQLERLRAIQVDFLDSTALLYNAYLNYGAALERRDRLPAALQVYRSAAALPDTDTARARARAAALAALLAPTPTSPAHAFLASIERNFVGSGNSGAFAACISGHDTSAGGPIDTAKIEVTNGPNRFSAVSAAGGFYNLCGLGASYWTVTLVDVPGDLPLGGQLAAVVYVSGERAQNAVVNFVER
jgi:tetratricopeptide (TPR) repeat protein